MVSALVLRPGLVPDARAQVAGPRVLMFQRQLANGDITEIGVIPVGKTYTIRDVTSSDMSEHGFVEFFADGASRAVVCSRGTENGYTGFASHFHAGIVIEGGSTLALRLSRNSARVTISGFIE